MKNRIWFKVKKAVVSLLVLATISGVIYGLIVSDLDIFRILIIAFFVIGIGALANLISLFIFSEDILE